MKNVVVCPTQEELDQGCPDDACECPYALAFKRVFRLSPDLEPFDGVEVTTFNVTLTQKGCVAVFSLPSDVLNWIRDFDSTGRLLGVELRPPPAWEFEVPDAFEVFA